MKKSRFTEVEVAYALRQAEAGTPVIDVSRSLGISASTDLCSSQLMTVAHRSHNRSHQRL